MSKINFGLRVYALFLRNIKIANIPKPTTSICAPMDSKVEKIPSHVICGICSSGVELSQPLIWSSNMPFPMNIKAIMNRNNAVNEKRLIFP
ncbi:hypothetical protein PN36_03290 [Candidatus Thiomargarita nelsonii]|uniref:Uncharacterized protein n=1 Tax=Candidatus Thiomargarita nelsonii TaxID=1003181 RepID=A0A4E0RU66_9GAMM|nr:hypothetical protein PN36_03290 [Candidatus Thiomargarita nelsonii]